MCIIHKGFRGLRALLLISIFGGNLIGLSTEIPYEIIREPFWSILGNGKP